MFCHIIPPPPTALSPEPVIPSQLRKRSKQLSESGHILQKTDIKQKNTRVITDLSSRRKIHPNLTFATQNAIFTAQEFEPQKLSFKQQLQKDLRGIFKCGDEFPECNTTQDCNSNRLQCYNQQCVPNLIHCSNVGCSSDYEKCNVETGECDSTRRLCETTSDCSQGFQCEDGKCYKETLFCRNDSDCAAVVDNGTPKPKCDIENKECVPCLHGKPSLCANQNLANPSCHVLDNICWESCDPIVSDFGKCCDAIQILDPKA
jgi:hypothetical protein